MRGHVETSLDAVAAEVGLHPDTLLDRQALAAVTDGMVPAGDAERERLPSFRALDFAGQWDGAIPGTDEYTSREVLPGRAFQAEVRQPGGTFAFAVWIARGASGDCARGVSLQLSEPNAAVPYLVRATRLR